MNSSGRPLAIALLFANAVAGCSEPAAGDPTATTSTTSTTGSA